MNKADTDQGLLAAKALAEAGVPIFLARPQNNKLGFKLPEGWEKTRADPSVADRWKPGMALCAVMGHVVDAIDVDPRNGGSVDLLKEALGGELPQVYGVQNTPSEGEHYLVATLGVRKVQNVVPGVDIQAGNLEGVGRGFIFLAPTERPNKLTGETAPYHWSAYPDLGGLLLEEDSSGERLAELVSARHFGSLENAPADYDGPSYAELGDALQLEADELVATQVASWKETLRRAASWPEGHRDERGRGWEALAYQSAWALAKMAACPWMGMDDVGSAFVYSEILPEEIADNDSCSGKWYDGIVDKAAGEAVDTPPWDTRSGDFERVKGRPVCNVTNPAEAGRWLDNEMGSARLSGLFRRKNDLIYTPCVGEEGYIPPKNDVDHDGPAQVKRMSPLQLSKRIDKSYRVIKSVGKAGNPKEDVFPEKVAERSMSLLDELSGLADLKMVSHTPLVRADGTVLDGPGYDEASGVLYLPERGLNVKPVSDVPTDAEVAAARDLLLSTVSGFPFVTDHDRANYLGCLLVPLLRILVPPPYKMLIIGAPQRGSGKTLLADVMRSVHGGVFRSEIPSEEDERRKVITSVLDSTSAPVVVFDNVSGVLKSSVFDGLLTSAEWSDRRLGVNVTVELPNDRLWVVTGNNVHIGGDLERRVLWCTINAKMEHPEERPPDAFDIPYLDQWAKDHRGDLLHAMLTMVRAWVVAGQAVDTDPTSDSFGRMISVLRGVLDVAGVPGLVGHSESAPKQADPDAEEFSAFLAAVVRVFGHETWTVRELLEKVGGSDFSDDEGIHSDELPGDIGARVRSQPSSASKALGRWLSYRTDRVRDGLVVRKSGSKKAALKWQVVEN